MSGRHTWFERRMGILARLLGGRSMRIQDFEDLSARFAMSERVLVEDLTALEDAADLQVVSYEVGEEKYWRMDHPKGYPAITHKRCPCSPKLQPIGNFSRNRASADGHSRLCDKCRHAMRRRWVENNRDILNRARRKYYRKTREHQLRLKKAQYLRRGAPRPTVEFVERKSLAR